MARGAAIGLARSLVREPVSTADMRRARSIHEADPDPGFGLTDASLTAVAERLDVPVLTLDRRRFGVFRTEGGKPLFLLP